MVVEAGEIQGVAIRYGTELVLVMRCLIGERDRRVVLIVPDVETLNAPGKGVADDAAIPTGDFHYNLAGVELTQDVRVYVHTPVGLSEYRLPVNRFLHNAHGS